MTFKTLIIALSNSISLNQLFSEIYVEVHCVQ